MHRIDNATTRMRGTESEYAQIRNDSHLILAANKHLKQDLALVQAALKTELDINEENALRLDTVKRNLYQSSEANNWELEKEQQLRDHLHERGKQILLKEDLLVEMDAKEREVILKHDTVALDIIRFRNGGGIVDHEVPSIQRNIDRLTDDKHQLLLKLRHEELKNSEISLRAEEVNDRLERRDKEYEDVERQLKAVNDHNDLLAHDKISLQLQKESCNKLTEDIRFANKEIEREFEEMLRVDETIQKTIDSRDRKVSPVIHFTR
jgi:DNA polymerase III psi subunit